MLKTSLLAVSTGVLLSGCNWGDDDDAPKGNTTPVAISEDLTTQADIAIMDQVTATDADGQSLSYILVTEPTLGMLTLESDGQFTYTPNPTVTGMDSFEFRASDGEAKSMVATVNITIEAQVVSFASYSRAAFAQQETDEPLPTNGREFTQDVTSPDAYDDLIDNP